MLKVLGIDLGVASIGWAVVTLDTENQANNNIIDCGVRIVPLDSKETSEFQKGGNVPTNVARRGARGMRRNIQRFKLRRYALYKALDALGMLPDDVLMTKMNPQELYTLRARGIQEQLSLQELGRVLVHLNLRRGFKSNRKAETDKQESAYKEAIKSREQLIRESNQTVGQYFVKGLLEEKHYRIRQQIFSRASYMEEFDKIWAIQASFYPQVLNDKNKRWIRDKIIFNQRPLKSAKHLVGTCAIEWNYALDKSTKAPIILANGMQKIVKPKCAPNSSPLAQACKVWESIHNLRVYDAEGIDVQVSNEVKNQLFYILQHSPKGLTSKKILKDVMKLSPASYSTDKLTEEKGLEGNRTTGRLLEVFKKLNIERRDLLEFNPQVEAVTWQVPETGEEITRLQLKNTFDQEPLYKFWHLLYATEEEADLSRLLQQRYGFTEEQARELAKIDFTSAGYARKSHRAMRRLLPHLQDGKDYAAACKAAGYNHSNSLNKAENEARNLLQSIDLNTILPKNSLRNPVVEKVLSQMIHIVNNVLEVYGRPDEIVIELARELKQHAKAREETSRNNRKNEKLNEEYRGTIAELLGIDKLAVTKKQIEKWKIGLETGWVSVYTGKQIDCASFLNGDNIDVEHIIPRTMRFDDSFSNKTICETFINQQKGNLTANDFIKRQPVAGLQSYESYRKMLKSLLDKKDGAGISQAKYERLLMSADDVVKDSEFLQRQLKDTQYIAKKAREILFDVSHTVRSSAGMITSLLRHEWGWDDAIHDTRVEQFGKIEGYLKKVTRNGREKVRIADWDKRKDHRHHALDAITAACTTQAHIQRINNLHKGIDKRDLQDRYDEMKARINDRRNNYLAGPRPFSKSFVQNALEHILVSYRQGIRVGTRSVNKKGTKKEEKQITLTPRGAFHNETIYGQIKRYAEDKTPLENLKMADLPKIAHPHQRELVEQRLAEYDGDIKKAFKNLAANPIIYGKYKDKQLKAVTLWEELFIARESISGITTSNKIKNIADSAIKKAVMARFEAGDQKKDAFKDLTEKPIIVASKPVMRARIINRASDMIELPRGFAQSDGNHHVAIYRTPNGEKKEHVVRFWDAFSRKKIGLPVVIKDVAAAYDYISRTKDPIADDMRLPESPEWTFVTSLARNEMFVFGLDPEEFDFKDPKNRALVSKNLFRVRKLSASDYSFIHHLEPEILDDPDSKRLNRAKRLNLKSLVGIVKVRLNHIGQIVDVSPMLT
jgi:CRISPR-associated endonuclease Csn1